MLIALEKKFCKSASLQEICLKSPLDIPCVDETKLGAYPNAQLHIDGYQFRPFLNFLEKEISTVEGKWYLYVTV